MGPYSIDNITFMFASQGQAFQQQSFTGEQEKVPARSLQTTYMSFYVGHTPAAWSSLTLQVGRREGIQTLQEQTHKSTMKKS